MEEKRLAFKCWQCKREYSLLRDLQDKPKFMTECPFCGQEAVVDLSPYRSQVMEIYQSPTPGEQAVGFTYQLPDVLPTRQLTAEDENL